MKYNSKYEYSRRFGKPCHIWSCVGAKGGLHLHISDKGKDDGYGRFHGGLEIHYRTPPDYMKDEAPSHNECWLLKAPCWHDGSSLVIEEFWVPFWQAAPNDIERMLKALEIEADERFNTE